jgi:uncharacterized membrane protein YeaQ/YmgE (transglycosylase-associated protein family)
MGFLAWIIVGLIAGWLAGQVMKGGGYGTLVDIILGILGGIVGGWIFGLLGIWPGGGMIGSIIVRWKCCMRRISFRDCPYCNSAEVLSLAPQDLGRPGGSSLFAGGREMSWLHAPAPAPGISACSEIQSRDRSSGGEQDDPNPRRRRNVEALRMTVSRARAFGHTRRRVFDGRPTSNCPASAVKSRNGWEEVSPTTRRDARARDFECGVVGAG